MDSLDVVEYIRLTEKKLDHIHKTMDELSLRPDCVEMVSALQDVAVDYKVKMEHAKELLREYSGDWEERED
ncbi:MAG: hypothetical protein ACM32O_16850 [Clostridia bacterium]